MFSKRAFIGLILLLGLLVLPVYAGLAVINISSFTGDCNSATVVYTSPGNFVRISIINAATGDILVPQFETVPNGSYTATFSPALRNGTTIQVNVTVEDEDSAQITVSCREQSEPYVELCADGRTNTNLCEPIAIYPIETDDGVGIAIWDTRRTGSEGELLYIAAEELVGLPDTSCLLGASADGFAQVVWLGGSMVIFAGPDDENKTFIFYYQTSFPSIPAPDTLFGGIELNLPAC
jgi:hypothetical protein